MGFQRGVVLSLLIVILLASSVFAANGCCALKDTGATCVYTAEEDCETPEYFLEGQYCEDDTSFCELGCCVKPDGLCGESTGLYTCDAEGGDWTAGACSEVDSCNKVCCQYGSTVTYNTQSYCETLFGDYGGEIDYYYDVTEDECVDIGRATEEGCCVSTEGCGYLTYEECTGTYGVDEFDASTGYGFYEGRSCSDISDTLESGGYEASEYCSCEFEMNVCDGATDIVKKDSCGISGNVVDTCNYPSQICYDADGTQNAECISTSCAAEDTFSFPEGSIFEEFNSYDVYHIGATYGGDFETLTLGQQDRANGESWCIYESPTGDFSDRVGSRHYEAYCVNGIEVINPCSENEGNERGEVCMVRYDTESEEFVGGCVDNNFDDYYTEELFDNSEGDYNDNLYYDRYSEPIENEEVSEEESRLSQLTEGVSTVPFAGSDYCSTASFDCSLWYADRLEGSEKKGWELYGNSICLKDDFVLMAADYCGSRGDCGLNLNVLGKAGSNEGFVVAPTQTNVGNAYVGHGETDESIVEKIFENPYRLNDGSFIGTEDLYYEDVEEKDLSSTCFNIDGYHEGNGKWGDYNYDHYYNYILQGLDMDLLPRVLYLQDFMGAFYYDRCNYYTSDSIADYYYEILLEDLDLVNSKFARDYMVNKWFSLETLIIYSTSFIPSNSEDSDGDTCVPSDQRFRKLVWGLGFNPSSSDGDYDSSMGSAVRNNPGSINDGEGWQYGELFIDFYNGFRSYKPWVLNKNSLVADPSTSLDGSQMPERSLTFYVGDIGGCGGGSEFANAKEKGQKEVLQQFTCDAWQPPEGGDDCYLCDTFVSEGGLVFDKEDGSWYANTQCTQTRCESLGSTCEFIENNAADAPIDKQRPSCVDGGGCNTPEKPHIKANTSLLDEQGIDYEVVQGDNKEEGIILNDLTQNEQYLFGFTTYGNDDQELYSSCKVVHEDAMPEGFGPGGEELGYDDFTSSIAFTYGSSYYYNFSDNFDYGEEKYYVVCKKAPCDDVMTDYYEIVFNVENEQDLGFKGINSVYPVSGSMVPNAQEEVELIVYLKEYATCKYSNYSTTSYESMLYEFSDCDTSVSGFSSANIYPVCIENIPLENGTTYLYILCEDELGNQQDSPWEWYVTKSSALEISQTSPSGDLYYDDIVLQVKTKNGGNEGYAICSFREQGDSYYITMENSYVIDHEQNLDNRPEGDYVYEIYCEDELSNTVEGTIEFSVLVDRSAAEITAIYYLGGTVYVITNENSQCQYDTESFSYGYGSDMAGEETAHTFSVSDLDQTYYINCIDEYANEMNEVSVDLRYYI